MATTVEDVRRHLREILGTEARERFSDEVIRKHIRNYQGRPDVLACALESLCEDYYEKSNRFLNNHLPECASPTSQSQRGPTEFFQNPFKRKKVRRDLFSFSNSQSEKYLWYLQILCFVVEF